MKSFSLGEVDEKESSMDSAITGSSISLNNTLPGTDSNINVIDKRKIITFGQSNEKADAGQSFVPYFDGRSITFDVKSPISGLGFWKIYK